MHIALLGDSILDNRMYTKGEPDVVTHLRGLLANVEATLCAIDGSTTADLGRQLANVPRDTTHVLLSIGGNDALMNSDMLALPVSSTGQALSLFGDRIKRFESSYRAAVDATLALSRKTAICSIYNGNLDPPEAFIARVALMMFNDVILRCAFEHALPVIDLRFVCSDKSDYANAIEPSGSGGLKIAKAIAGWLAAERGNETRVFTE
jgi:GDSL-like Lipase/Acylhydrolase family